MAASHSRLAVEAWLDQYEQRFLVRQPQEIDTIRHEISAMSDRQIETFAGWLQEKGAIEAPALPIQDATSLRGFGLPRWPRGEPEGHPAPMSRFGHAAATALARAKRVARHSVPAAGG
jgi:hypothetical protein